VTESHERLAPAVARWEQRGQYRTLAGHEIFTLEIPATGREVHEPLLVLHGFPTSSFDFHLIADSLATQRRVLLLDLLGFGLSAKPDLGYTMALQADVVMAWLALLGVSECALLTHDMGDTVGGELLARVLDGRSSLTVERRVLTNGSIYIEMAHLSAGQLLLLDLPDEPLPREGATDAAAIAQALRGTLSPQARPPDAELSAAAELVIHRRGHRLLPRTIRYIEERRRSQDRFTGAIETHPSPLAIVWGVDDPIAVVDMATRLHAACPSSSLDLLDGVGHYPMLEAPDRFAAAVHHALA
jgi:pimeloyl-ACP methyl ester carboxylesterase